MDPRFPKLRSQGEIDALIAAQTKTPVLSARPVLRFAAAALTPFLSARPPQSPRP